MINERDTELLESLLDGEVQGPQKAELEARLAAEEAMRSQLAALQADRALRRQLWESYEPAEPAVEGMLAAIRASEARRAWYLRLLDHRQHVAAAAACVAVFLIGWQWGAEANALRMSTGAMTNTQGVRLITQQQVPAGFEVRVTDENGRLVRQERFATLEQARQYVEQMRQELSKPKE